MLNTDNFKQPEECIAILEFSNNVGIKVKAHMIITITPPPQVNKNFAPVKKGEAPKFVKKVPELHLTYKKIVNGDVINTPDIESHDKHRMRIVDHEGPKWIHLKVVGNRFIAMEIRRWEINPLKDGGKGIIKLRLKDEKSGKKSRTFEIKYDLKVDRKEVEKHL